MLFMGGRVVVGLRWEYDVRCKFAVSSGFSLFDPGFSSPKGEPNQPGFVVRSAKYGELVGDDWEEFSGFAFWHSGFCLVVSLFGWACVDINAPGLGSCSMILASGIRRS